MTSHWKKIIGTVVLTCCCIATYAQTHADTLVQQLQDRNARKVIVVAHRGDWRNAPENSLQALKNCIRMGVDMVEIDLKKTKDNVLVIMHDATIDRTTNGKGRVEDYTLAELRQFRLKNGLGRATTHPIPTLEEMLTEAKGKILINIDKGYDYFQDAYNLLEKTGTTAQAVIKSGYAYEKVAAENGDVLSKVVYMPIVNLNDAEAEKLIDGYKAIQPVAMECCFSEYNSEVERLLQKVQSIGSKVWINSLWPSLNASHDDDKAVEENQKDAVWGWILDRGASLIQTDRPSELIDYLQKSNRR